MYVNQLIDAQKDPTSIHELIVDQGNIAIVLSRDKALGTAFIKKYIQKEG